jgi:hypothetical protein
MLHYINRPVHENARIVYFYKGKSRTMTLDEILSKIPKAIDDTMRLPLGGKAE